MPPTALGLPASSGSSGFLLSGRLLSRVLFALAPEKAAVQFTIFLVERLVFRFQLLDPAKRTKVEFAVIVGLLPQGNTLLP